MDFDPKPFNFDFLPVEDNHQIYFEQYGNPKGQAIVVLHGGPGAKSKPRHIKSFDLSKFHVITFHQRGCGKSLPMGEIKGNTTQKLISDIERLRIHLKIKTWFVAGGSWGSTLALAYAETYPKVVNALLLSQIFLGRDQDATWQLDPHGGLDRIFPDLWQYRSKFHQDYGINSPHASADILQLLEQSDLKTVSEITAHILNWEGNLMNAQADLSFIDSSDINEELISMVRIGLHYEANNYFLTKNQLLANIKSIASIPTIIVHGRYDLLCPAGQAWDLHQHLPQSDLVMLPTSNHRLTAEGELVKKFAFHFFLEKYTK